MISTHGVWLVRVYDARGRVKAVWSRWLPPGLFLFGAKVDECVCVCADFEFPGWAAAGAKRVVGRCVCVCDHSLLAIYRSLL